MQEKFSAGAVYFGECLKNDALVVVEKEGMFAVRYFAFNVLTRYNELYSVSCQRAIDKQRLLMEHSAIRR